MTNNLSLQVTYEGGRPLAAYLYLTSNGKRTVGRSEEVGDAMVVDYAADGSPLGLEILSPASVSVEEVWAIFDRLGLERPSASDLGPLSAA